MRDFLSNRPKIDDLPAGKATLKPAGLAALASSALPAAAAGHSDHGGACETPKVDLSYDAEGRVQEIRITCRCGERIALRCVY